MWWLLHFSPYIPSCVHKIDNSCNVDAWFVQSLPYHHCPILHVWLKWRHMQSLHTSIFMSKWGFSAPYLTVSVWLFVLLVNVIYFSQFVCRFSVVCLQWGKQVLSQRHGGPFSREDSVLKEEPAGIRTWGQNQFLRFECWLLQTNQPASPYQCSSALSL